MGGRLSTVGCGGKKEKMDPSQEVGMTMGGVLSTVGCGGKEEKMDPSQEVGMTMRGRLNTVGCGGKEEKMDPSQEVGMTMGAMLVYSTSTCRVLFRISMPGCRATKCCIMTRSVRERNEPGIRMQRFGWA